MWCIFPSSAMKKGALVGICLVSIRIPGRYRVGEHDFLNNFHMSNEDNEEELVG